MRRTIRSVTVGLAVLISAVPVVLTAVLTWNAVDGLIDMPRGFVAWALSYTTWWVGFAAAMVFARKLSHPSGMPWRAPFLVSALVIGLIAVGWLEVKSWEDPKHVFPPSFFAIPYLCSIGAGWIARMLSNNTAETDAQQAARGSL